MKILIPQKSLVNGFALVALSIIILSCRETKTFNKEQDNSVEETLKYYCCTSHIDTPHCDLELINLQDTHPSNEIYTRK